MQHTQQRMSYTETIQAIQLECGKINLVYSSEGDGRITSAVKEKEYLDALEKGLKQDYPSFTILRPKERFWYDIRINTLPINLKITSGGTDNAFNKVAVLYTLSGMEVEKRNMNYNQFLKTIKECPKKASRDRMTEYHYLVVNKDDGKVLLKSILDIHTYKTNPCNDMQINWKNEFHHLDFAIQDERFKDKVKELLKTVQSSIRQLMASMKEFSDADMDTLM